MKNSIIVVLLVAIISLVYLLTNTATREINTVNVQLDAEQKETNPRQEVIPREQNLPQESDSEENKNDMRSTVNINEKNPDSDIICPDDVFVCTAGGNGEPNYSIELKRVPPTCGFPVCPG